MVDKQQYQIREDEACPFCQSADLTHIGHDVDGYWVGMECEELHCNTCGADHAVGCVETADYTAFREAHPHGRYVAPKQAEAGEAEGGVR